MDGFVTDKQLSHNDPSCLLCKNVIYNEDCFDTMRRMPKWRM